jgi:hypothetical protein
MLAMVLRVQTSTSATNPDLARVTLRVSIPLGLSSALAELDKVWMQAELHAVTLTNATVKTPVTHLHRVKTRLVRIFATVTWDTLVMGLRALMTTNVTTCSFATSKRFATILLVHSNAIATKDTVVMARVAPTLTSAKISPFATPMPRATTTPGVKAVALATQGGVAMATHVSMSTNACPAQLVPCILTARTHKDLSAAPAKPALSQLSIPSLAWCVRIKTSVRLVDASRKNGNVSIELGPFGVASA